MSDDDTERAVSAHYSRGDLLATIEAALRGRGLDPAHLTAEQLAPLDNFHSFGVAGTLELLRLANIQPSEHVLDVGGGIGGPARLLASRVGCAVTVLDLSAEFCRTGETLTEWTHLADCVSFTNGSALAMPFADAGFDVAWTQHAAMNIADKPRLYAEIHRVLRPGGRFALFDTVAGPNPPLIFPVPWARDPSSSFLLPPDEVRALILAAGFAEQTWLSGKQLVDQLAQSAPIIPPSQGAPAAPPLSPAVLMGPDAPLILANAGRNTQEGRTTLALGVFERI